MHTTKALLPMYPTLRLKSMWLESLRNHSLMNLYLNRNLQYHLQLLPAQSYFQRLLLLCPCLVAIRVFQTEAIPLLIITVNLLASM
jgi:hypothetical protein